MNFRQGKGNLISEGLDLEDTLGRKTWLLQLFSCCAAARNSSDLLIELLEIHQVKKRCYWKLMETKPITLIMIISQRPSSQVIWKRAHKPVRFNKFCD